MTTFRLPAFNIGIVLLVTVAIGTAQDAIAQGPANQPTAQPAAQQPAEMQLTIGDQYAITAQRAQVQVRYDGVLAVANRDWIMLRHVSEGRNEYSTPVVGAIPYVQRWFRGVSIGRECEYIWISRSAITKCERLTQTPAAESSGVVQAAAKEALQASAPPMRTDCSVEILDGNKVAIRHGKLNRVAGGKLTLACLNQEIRERPSRTPIFGSFFPEQYVASTTTIESHSLDKVLAIRVPFDLREANQ